MAGLDDVVVAGADVMPVVNELVESAPELDTVSVAEAVVPEADVADSEASSATRGANPTSCKQRKE